MNITAHVNIEPTFPVDNNIWRNMESFSKVSTFCINQHAVPYSGFLVYVSLTLNIMRASVKREEHLYQ